MMAPAAHHWLNKKLFLKSSIQLTKPEFLVSVKKDTGKFRFYYPMKSKAVITLPAKAILPQPALNVNL